ncbi:hypothetical protein JCM10207_006731 [Rhodosporidiobolus poonsookiae]
MSRRPLLPLPASLQRLSLSSRDERRYLPYVALGCLALVLYIQPHQPSVQLDPAYFSWLSSSSSSSGSSTSASNRPAAAPLPLNDFTSPSSLAALVLPRLSRLSAAPILSYSASLELESTRCPGTYLQSNRDQLAGEGEEYWPTVGTEELREARERVVERVTERFGLREESGGLEDALVEGLMGTKGRGLVFTAGNKDTMRRLLTSLRILRKHHDCHLPAEIFGFPSELQALGKTKEDIDALGGITWREIKTSKVEGAWKQFQIKGEAIARSSFREVLYLDSDNIALRDPTFLFDSPAYREHGIVLWPDFNRDSAANPVWRLLDTPCDPAHMQAETGQLLVNKRARGGLNLVALEVARAMQEDSRFWFHLSGGDKDTFRYAFYFLSLPFTLAPHYPSALGGPLASPSSGHTFCGHTMLQYGLSAGEWDPLRAAGAVDPSYIPPGDHAPPLFAHANVLKHSGYSNRRGTTFRALKKATEDRLFPPPPLFRARSHAPLAEIRQTGFTARKGMCVDVWDVREAGEGAEGADEGAYERGEVEVVKWEEAWGGVARGLEEMYYDEGGIGGGW